jgi:hypothetical protein
MKLQIEFHVPDSLTAALDGLKISKKTQSLAIEEAIFLHIQERFFEDEEEAIIEHVKEWEWE